MENESLNKKTLELQKLEMEVRLLIQQKRWEFWKSLSTTILIPIFTIATLCAGGIRYFRDEATRQRLRMEEVLSSGLREIESEKEFARLGAILNLLFYAEKENNYNEILVTVLTLRATKEPSEIVKQTILGNLKKWKKENNKLFNDFLDNVRKELSRADRDLQDPKFAKNKDSLIKQLNILKEVENVLSGL